MIIKSSETNKINLNKNPFILLYGKNDGLKNQTLTNLLKNKKNALNYEEKEILDKIDIFLESIFSQSLFENEKILIVKRGTDKILKVISEIIFKDTKDVIIIVISDNLEKKSKLRSFFEKEKNCICVPFYPDNEQTLSKLAYNFFREKNISLSSADINIIINKSAGDRENMFNELKKVEYFVANGKKISSEKLAKLTNLIENHSISELVDNCIAKNKRKTINILVENNFSNEDCVLITRIFLNKFKKILKLSNEFQKNHNIDLTISKAKPPIFWKEKEITKQQMLNWTPEKIKKSLYKIYDIELLIKKNSNNSINLVTDFILNQVSNKTNN
tara:strand:- start:1837 stop:2829 length:993 start_codon:yes stop_codon:yes gene_type:complete